MTDPFKKILAALFLDQFLEVCYQAEPIFAITILVLTLHQLCPLIPFHEIVPMVRLLLGQMIIVGLAVQSQSPEYSSIRDPIMQQCYCNTLRNTMAGMVIKTVLHAVMCWSLS